MRVTQLICGSFVAASLSAAACGDDSARRAAPGESGAGGMAAGTAASDSGGSSTEPAVAGGGAGTSEGGGGSLGIGGGNDCVIGPEEGQPDDYLYQFQSGTRLQARYYQAPDMPDVFAGFFDTELDEWCDFMLASDDSLRCLPRSTAVTGHLGYADALCQTDVWTLSPGCSAAQPRVRRQLECSDKADVWTLEPYSGVPWGGSECISTDVEAPADAYTFGSEEPPASFVAGTLVDVPGPCRAGLRVVEATDGARGPMHVFDLASGIACTPGVAGCKPLKLAFEDPTLRADDSCETAPEVGYATWNDAETCAPPELVRPASSDVDGYYRAGPLSDAELYAEPDGGCEPARTKPWIGAIYELGEVVPASSLPDLSAEWQGTGALQIAANAELGKPLMALLDGNVRFRHSALDQDCNLRELGDGSLRCIPTELVSGGGFQDEFNDPECTVPVRRCTENCPGKLVFDENVDDQACSSQRATTAIWAYSEPATAYYRESPGFPCYAGGTPSPDMWTVEAVDPSELPEATLEVAE